MSGFDIKAFLQKHRNLIWGVLSFLFIVNFCGRQAQQPAPGRVVADEQRVEAASVPQDGKSLKSYEEIMRERAIGQESRPGGFVVTLILMVVGALLFWQYQTRWKSKWFPGKIKFNAERSRDKNTGRQLLRLTISNRTGESQTFLAPMIVFTRWGSQRQFKLRGTSEHMFPLTLMPGTSHRIVIDLDQFFEKMPELNRFNRVGGSVATAGGKVYHSFSSFLRFGI